MPRKVAERIYLEWFLNKVRWDRCSVQEGEAPDFAIEFDNKKVGVEITNLYIREDYKGSLEKRQEELWSKFLKNLAQRYYQACSVPILLKVLFESKKLPTETDSLVSKLKVSETIDVWERHDFYVKKGSGSGLKVWIVRLPEAFQHYSRWTCINSHVGFSHPIDLKVLHKRIEAKKTKLSQYKQKYEKTILLLVADRIVNSGRFHFSEKGLRISEPGFDSVYLVLYPEELRKIG